MIVSVVLLILLLKLIFLVFFIVLKLLIKDYALLKLFVELEKKGMMNNICK